MEPSRCRRPLLPPVPLPFPRLTRFFFSHPHPVRRRMGERERQIRCSAPMGNISKLPVRLRMGERGRQIRRSALMGNISKLKRGRSRVTPRGTCQTLTSSSKVEATHRGSSSRPPLDLLNCPDEFKSLEMDRLLPCDLETTNPTALQQYDDYLKWFYHYHKGPAAAVKSLVDMASMCLEKERIMLSLWVTSRACTTMHSAILDEQIDCYMRVVIEENGKTEHPFGINAAECIAKEDELITEWLRHGRRIFTDDEYTLCHSIRDVAAVLFICCRKWSFHIAAALVAMRKEAEWMIENLKRNSGESISTSLKIRQFALDLVLKKFDELEPCEDKKSTKSESESESETSSESDDDVAESQDDNYVGGCPDELYGFISRGMP